VKARERREEGGWSKMGTMKKKKGGDERAIPQIKII